MTAFFSTDVPDFEPQELEIEGKTFIAEFSRTADGTAYMTLTEVCDDPEGEELDEHQHETIDLIEVTI